MERELVVFFILFAVTIGVGAQAWTSWLEHKRRTRALDVIKAAIEAGREPPQQLYDQLSGDSGPYNSLGLSKRPWAESVIFAAVAMGFWVAFMNASGEDQEKFLLVATIMSVSALGCLALAAFPPGQRRDDKR